MTLTPYPHQIEGAEFFAESGNGILGDEMGLGKGGTFLTWLKLIKAKRTLVTGPKEITNNLLSEIPKWEISRPVIDLRGYRQSQRDSVVSMLNQFDEFIALLNFEAWRHDQEMLSRLVSLRFDSVVIDEAHHLNNGKTLNYRGLREIIYAVNKCPDCGYRVEPVYSCQRKKCSRYKRRFSFRYCLACGLIATEVRLPRCEVCGADPKKDRINARSVRNVLEATGTPVLNHCKEFFWILSLVDKSFTSERDFLNEFTFVDSRGRHVWTPTGKKRLIQRINHLYLARKRTDTGIRLPPQTINVREYDFDTDRYADQWKAYKRLEDEFKLDVESETLGVTEVVVQLLRLRQMLVWPKSIPGITIDRSFKLDIVTDLAREFLEAGQRLVIFSHFTEPLRELYRRLGSVSVVYDGTTSQSQREAIRADFSAGSHTPRWQAALCNYKSAGEGLNLVGATQAIILDEDWSPGKNQQAYGRINRIGQTKETAVHIPRILGTSDMWMAELNEFKTKIDSEVILEAIKKARNRES